MCSKMDRSGCVTTRCKVNYLEIKKIKERMKENLRIEELRNMYPSPNIIKTKKRNETGWICSTHGVDEKIVR
jgi:hypothetical protein